MTALKFVNDIAKIMGWETVTTLAGTQTKETAAIIEASDTVLSSIQGDEDWQDLSVETTLTTLPVVSWETSVWIVRGDATITVTTPGFTAADVGKKFAVSGTNLTYRVKTYTSTTEIELDRVWAEDDVDDIRTVYLGQDTYELPEDYDNMLVQKLFCPIANAYADIVGPGEVSTTRIINGLGFQQGVPEKCTIHGRSTDGAHKLLHFDVCPTVAYVWDYQYQKKHPALSGDSIVILYPDKDMLYIKDMVVARLKRDAEASQSAGQVAADVINSKNRIGASKEAGSEALRMVPIVRPHGRRRRRF